jgi:hypothetical protein
MSATSARERALLDHQFGGVALTPEATWHWGLSSTAPSDDGSNFTEPSGNGYARVAKTNNATNFPAASTDGLLVTSKVTGTAITWATPTGSWAAGAQLTHIGAFSAATGGTPHYVFALATPIIVVGASSAPVEVPAGLGIFGAD